MDKLQKVRADIERLIVDYNIKTEKYRGMNKQAHQYYGGKRDALSEILKSIDSMQEEPKSKFEQSIQEGDNIVYNEDLGCRVNLSQLKRVAKKEDPVSDSETVEAQNKEVYMKPHSEPIYLGIGGIPINAPKYLCKEEPKKCMYSEDDYTDEDREWLCDGCNEECKYSKKEESVSDDLDREITKLHLRFHNIDMLAFEEIARHFAEWSKVNSMRILLTKDKDK